MEIRSQLRAYFLRTFWFFSGIALLVLGLIGKTREGLKASPWKRALVIAGALYFVYASLVHCLPKNRKLRQQMKRDLDEAEKELDEIERKMSPKRDSNF